VLEVTGTGYLRMFTMIVQAIQNRKANYYFMLNPETSIHPVLFHPFIDFLINHVAKFMKFVVVTNCANPHMHYSHLSNTVQIVDNV
jgi:predicted ATPase